MGGVIWVDGMSSRSAEQGQLIRMTLMSSLDELLCRRGKERGIELGQGRRTETEDHKHWNEINTSGSYLVIEETLVDFLVSHSLPLESIVGKEEIKSRN